MWRNCRFTSPPFLLPEDKPFIPKSLMSVFRGFDEFASSSAFGRRHDETFHTGLLPIPYVGNLESASVIILMLNPGLSPGDYFAEQKVKAFRDPLIRTLRQENQGDEYPFMYLDPHFAWSPGGRYWQNKLCGITEALSERTSVTYQQALRRLSRELAVLQLVPYHSKNFSAGSLVKSLRSTKVMTEYVLDIVVPKAEKDEAVVVVTRSVKNWGLPLHKNIIVYEGAESRSAHLTLNSRGGKVIAQRIGL